MALPLEKNPMKTETGYSNIVGRLARSGTWRSQTESTFSRIKAAARRNDPANTAGLVSCCVEECRICYRVMKQWQQDVRAFLESKDAGGAALREREAALIATFPKVDDASYDSESAWLRFLETLLDLQRDAYAGATDAARAGVDKALARWDVISAVESDWAHGLIDCVIKFLGEEAIPEMWEHVIQALFQWRYQKFDVSRRDWATEILPELLYVAIEAERTWLSTAGRDGSPIDVREFDDRWEMHFDPCGTGGRGLAHKIRGTEGRPDFDVVANAHPWTDGKAGVCSYCTHCLVLMEHMPMDAFGYPLRVVEPPLLHEGDPQAKCKWTMYKNPADAPAEVYARCGRAKPALPLGSKRDAVPSGFGNFPAGIEIDRNNEERKP